MQRKTAFFHFFPRSNAIDEGYIKFTVHLTDGPAPTHPDLDELNRARTQLHDLGLIGMYPNGIGYGNISLRANDPAKFIISGSATGDKRVLDAEEYCLVDSFNLATNEVLCTGQIKASSESMSHGAVYRASPDARCVIHIHNRELFDFMLAGSYPRTSATAAFGTPELAKEIGKLSVTSPKGEIFATAGHEEGIIAYGPTIADALRKTLDLLKHK